MNRKLYTAGLSATVVLGLAAASASATVIGDPSQNSDQAVNGTQLANAPTATGDVIVVGPVAAGPTPTQSSTNVLESGQAVGSPLGGTAIISPDGKGTTQNSKQGVNGGQYSANGAIGEQDSANVLGSTQLVGGDLSCVPGVCDPSIIIGSSIQDNQQGVNGIQSADGGVTTGDSITTPTVILNGLAAPVSQFSLNDIENSQVVLG
jgi:hypothetical protein